MSIDIRTLAIILSVTNAVQAIAIFLQYLTNKTYRGLGWWVLGFSAMAVGFILLLLRDIISGVLLSIMSANTLIVTGSIFIYIGIMYFLDKKKPHWIVISVIFVFIVSFFYYTYMNNDIAARTAIVSAALALISFLTAECIYFNKTHSVMTSANFLSVVLFAYGCFMVFRVAVSLTVFPVDNIFTPTLIQATAFLVQIIEGIFVTLGLIIMINQRLNAEMKEAKEEMNMVFNISPDAAIISRLNDGLIVNVNEGFSGLLGFTRGESIGKTSLDINIWANKDDRQAMTSELRGKGFIDNLEVQLRKKDGGLVHGLISAKIINLQNVPHIISITRDISVRKRADETLRENEERLRFLSDNLPNGMVYQVDFGEDGSSRTFVYVSAGVERLHGITPAEVREDATAIYNQVHEEDRPYLSALEAEVMAAMSNLKAEFRVRQPSGEIRWHLINSSPRRLANNHLIWDGIEIDITDRKEAEEERERLILNLKAALSQIKTLSGLLPICSSCKKIRDDKGYWEQIEVYIRDHSEADFSHGICPDCAKILYPDFYKTMYPDDYKNE